MKKEKHEASVKIAFLCFTTSLFIFAIFTLSNDVVLAQNLEWVARISQPTNSCQHCNLKLALDDCGNAYTLVEYSDDGENSDLLTTKFDKNGNPVWQARYNGPSNGDEYPVAIKVDKFGCVYITGESISAGWYDYVTIKYSPNGNELWAARYDSPAKGSDRPVGLIVDPDGNVYVSGTSWKYTTVLDPIDGHYNANDYYDYVTIKYDQNGNVLWRKTFDASEFPSSHALSLTTDAESNLYLLVEHIDKEYNSFRIAIIKYDKQGNELWMRSFPWYFTPLAVIDSAGNVYLADREDPGCRIGRLNSDGQLLFDRWIGEQGGTSLVGLIIDNDGDIYLAGSEENAENGLDYVLGKYDSNGNFIGKATYNPVAEGMSWEGARNLATGMATDSDGGIYITGYAGDIYTVKFDLSGNRIWSARWEGGPSTYSGYTDRSYEIAVDRLKKVFIGGYSIGADRIFNYVLIKYSQADDGSTEDDYPTCPVYEGNDAGFPTMDSTNSAGGGGCFIDAVSSI